jgi:glutathione peroxidase
MSRNDILYDIQVKSIDGATQKVGDFAGKAMLIVNVASKCGFTPQYKELEAVYRKFKDKGLVVLGFPCDQFGGQEPGDEEEIKNFCSLKYDVTFPMFAKIDVSGDNAHPLYRHLKRAAPGVLGTQSIKWNFTKFLVSPDGKVVARCAPNHRPSALEQDICAVLPT